MEAHLKNTDSSLTVLSVHIVSEVETAHHVHYAQKLFQVPRALVSSVFLQLASYETPMHSPGYGVAYQDAQRADYQRV